MTFGSLWFEHPRCTVWTQHNKDKNLQSNLDWNHLSPTVVQVLQDVKRLRILYGKCCGLQLLCGSSPLSADDQD